MSGRSLPQSKMFRFERNKKQPLFSCHGLHGQGRYSLQRALHISCNSDFAFQVLSSIKRMANTNVIGLQFHCLHIITQFSNVTYKKHISISIRAAAYPLSSVVLLNQDYTTSLSQQRVIRNHLFFSFDMSPRTILVMFFQRQEFKNAAKRLMFVRYFCCGGRFLFKQKFTLGVWKAFFQVLIK